MALGGQLRGAGFIYTVRRVIKSGDFFWSKTRFQIPDSVLKILMSTEITGWSNEINNVVSIRVWKQRSPKKSILFPVQCLCSRSNPITTTKPLISFVPSQYRSRLEILVRSLPSRTIAAGESGIQNLHFSKHNHFCEGRLLFLEKSFNDCCGSLFKPTTEPLSKVRWSDFEIFRIHYSGPQTEFIKFVILILSKNRKVEQSK